MDVPLIKDKGLHSSCAGVVTMKVTLAPDTITSVAASKPSTGSENVTIARNSVR